MSSWPWRLAKLIDPNVPQEEAQGIAHQLFQANECCLDDISLRLRAKIGAELDVFLPRTAHTE